MALEEQLKQPEPEQSESVTNMTDEEEQDLTIAVLLAERLIDSGGVEVIEQAVAQSSDAGQVIGQFLMQMVSQMNENLPPDIQLSPKIYFAHGGWVEQVSDYIQEQYDVERSVMDRAEMYIATSAQEMAKSKQAGAAAPQGQPAAPAPAGPPPMPAAGGM
jgi:hypothetical protein